MAFMVEGWRLRDNVSLPGELLPLGLQQREDEPVGEQLYVPPAHDDVDGGAHLQKRV